MKQNSKMELLIQEAMVLVACQDRSFLNLQVAFDLFHHGIQPDGFGNKINSTQITG